MRIERPAPGLAPGMAGPSRQGPQTPAGRFARTRAWAWPLLAIGLIAIVLAAPPHSFAGGPGDTVVVGRPSVDIMVGEGRILRFDGPVDSVFVADASIADLRVVSADVIYVYGKKSGMTNLIALSSEQKIRATVQLRISTNPQPANDAVRKLQPTTTTDISIFGNRAAVTGHGRSIEDAVDAENIGETYSPPGQPPINDMTIDGSQQINIRVRFAEVSRNELQALGFNWRVFASTGSLGFGSQVNIDVLIEALQREGLVTILAEPNLTAATGQTASFLAGGEVPVPIPQANGLMSMEYKPYGVSLQFTPTIIRTNRIALHVRPEVSALSHTGALRLGGVDVPSFTVRRADTIVEVASGQTFALAGLFQRQLSQDFAGIPGLSDLPVLGALFTSEHYRRDETELVILITPYLVKPISDHLATTPLDRPAVALPPPVKPVHSQRSSGLIVK